MISVDEVLVDHFIIYHTYGKVYEMLHFLNPPKVRPPGAVKAAIMAIVKYICCLNYHRPFTSTPASLEILFIALHPIFDSLIKTIGFDKFSYPWSELLRYR